MVDSFLALMHRYVVDYTNAHDMSVLPQIMVPDYRIHIGGETLDLVRYRKMVVTAYDRFPDLTLFVHEFVTNGERLAMHFSETATSSAHGGRRGVWEGIALYRRAADGRLAENFVEQDFYGRRQQFAGEFERPAPAEDPAVWSVAVAPSSRHAEAVLSDWLAAADAADAGAGSTGGPVIQDGEDPIRLLSERTTAIDDLFSAGSRVAFRATVRGRYRGALHGVAEGLVGTSQHLHCVGLASVEDGRVTDVTMVRDRHGLRARLRSG